MKRAPGASDIVKAKSSGEDPRATGGLVSDFPHPRKHPCSHGRLNVGIS